MTRSRAIATFSARRLQMVPPLLVMVACAPDPVDDPGGGAMADAAVHVPSDARVDAMTLPATCPGLPEDGVCQGGILSWCEGSQVVSATQGTCFGDGLYRWCEGQEKQAQDSLCVGNGRRFCAGTEVVTSLEPWCNAAGVVQVCADGKISAGGIPPCDADAGAFYACTGATLTRDEIFCPGDPEGTILVCPRGEITPVAKQSHCVGNTMTTCAGGSRVEVECEASSSVCQNLAESARCADAASISEGGGPCNDHLDNDGDGVDDCDDADCQGFAWEIPIGGDEVYVAICCLDDAVCSEPTSPPQTAFRCHGGLHWCTHFCADGWTACDGDSGDADGCECALP
jgi:hypothetical protein